MGDGEQPGGVWGITHVTLVISSPYLTRNSYYTRRWTCVTGVREVAASRKNFTNIRDTELSELLKFYTHFTKMIDTWIAFSEVKLSEPECLPFILRCYSVAQY